jgi:hypothetical protein
VKVRVDLEVKISSGYCKDPSTILGGREHYYSHCTDVNTEAWQGSVLLTFVQ